MNLDALELERKKAWEAGRDAASQCAESADNTAGRITISLAIRALTYPGFSGPDKCPALSC